MEETKYKPYLDVSSVLCFLEYQSTGILLIKYTCNGNSNELVME